MDRFQREPCAYAGVTAFFGKEGLQKFAETLRRRHASLGRLPYWSICPIKELTNNKDWVCLPYNLRKGSFCVNKMLSFSRINQGKTDFSDLYTSEDPRKYFKYLGQLDYIIPHLAQPVFRQVIQARQELQEGPVTVLDVGCSYAINGALMKYALDYEALRQRYTAPALQGLSSEQMLEFDRHYYRAWPGEPGIKVIGLDASANAVRYAETAGVLDRGLAIDLEQREPTPEEMHVLADVDLIVSTGCVGYVTAKSFQRLAKAARVGRAPWVASFVLRMFPYDEIAATLSAHGLVTELYEGATFVQRRFADRSEMEATIRAVEARGLDSDGLETEGFYHANLFVSRPAEEIVRRPIQKLVSVVSGANKLWSVGANVLGSFGQHVRQRARAERALGTARAASSRARPLAPGASGRMWSAWRQHHDHLAAFELGILLDLGHLADVVLHPIEQLISELLVRHFAAAEAQGDLDLVAFFEEALHCAHLHVVIVVVDHRPQLDFLDLDDVLFLASLCSLLLRLVLELAVVQELAHGRAGVWGDFDQIKPRGLRHFQRGLDGSRAVVVARCVDQLDLADADLVIDARAVFLNGQRGLHRTANGGYLLCC
jgi:hypothetical protein